MDSVEVNEHMDSSKDVSAVNSVSPEVCGIYDIFGEPELQPRVGDQYQVVIPSLITVSDYKTLTDAKMATGGCHNVLIGLPIPIMWISEESENKKHEEQEAIDVSNKNESLKSECISDGIVLGGSDLKLKIEPLDITSMDGIKEGKPENLVLEQDVMPELQLKHGGNGHCLVPGCLSDIWSNIEDEWFLLGLYIFGKNLVLVKNFIEGKQMGDILSYYYGRFYRSERYCRWSECRKIKTRRCIYGQRIFTGLRHQELLSRLLPRVSQDCQNAVLESSKTYGEGKILLEEYVFTLKASFGLNALVEAVGIGKGKQDLTGISMETPRSNQVVRPEIPIGKACSTLTTPEIVNFLTGDFRLSKARSSDLFWEAVWPRLLARGWHSEEPNNHGVAAGSKHSLVFLIPGIKKFSRRKLVKGEHYYDSVSDVLSKVASDPEILKIESYRNKEENGWTSETKLDQEDLPNQQRHFYLKPRTPNDGTDVMKFTVVDTSLGNGKARKVRELRSLPIEIIYTPTSLSDSEEDDGDSFDESLNKSSSADTLCSEKDETTDLRATIIDSCKTLPFGGKAFNPNTLEHGFPVKDLTIVSEKIHKDKEADILNSKMLKEAAKSKLIRKMISEDQNHLAPVAKRRRRLPPICKEMSHSTINSRVDSRLQLEASSCVDNSYYSENILSQVDPSQDTLSSTSSSRGGSPMARAGCILSSNHMGAEIPQDKPPIRTLIDLNVAISPDAETDEYQMMDTTEGKDHQMANPHAVELSECAAISEQEAKVCSRRQSTRNRPLTTKVLEAFACGFLDIKQKRKSKDAFPGDNIKLRPSRRPRARVTTPPESFDSITVDFPMEERGSSIQNTNGDVFNKLGISTQTG
ncbi:uncharacterized protein LOC133819382 [Humulus lupulus]|uniref:uncharacterized protein LOC133819382 n=1 Tax=Humulus lupulus TaxID=3486 RepID=UPI002B40DB7D|nr:uncharacterized protein LOC133819382 [Humulus lupulus]XP_062108600.1 uncharacterized protein LOC133819382 [Humulus lupulus]XP_062108601.1 uncharacterized protein LOC133819382 [Humulus lupulus]XP_062108602.1 uncharacterized protein LOC133819382 [Humulus lupulus]XP_062108603.1 uncharacterized protein LOC133819382 [Humulus lupulus]